MLVPQRYLKIGLILTICLLSLVGEHTGLYSYPNRLIGDARMAASPKEFDQNIVFVAVDTKSLNAIGAWPWSRSVHAQLLDLVNGGGALDVLLDFDFAFPSDFAGDAALAAALRRAGGATYLAVFEQIADATDPTSRHANLPHAQFAAHSWPALVNVEADNRAMVRDYSYGRQIGETFVMSAGALLAGQLESTLPPFEIDFSLRPESVVTISAIDVLNGVYPDGFFDAKIVIVGASAIELSDQLAVPVHGIVSGPLIHAMATETLLRDLALRWLRGGWVALVMLVSMCLIHLALPRNHLLALGAIVGFLALFETSALWVFQTSNVMIPSAMLYPGMLGMGLWAIVRSLLRRTWLLSQTSAQARNRLRLLERVFDDGSEGIVVLDVHGCVLRHSRSAKEMLGTNDAGALNIPNQFLQLARQSARPSSGTETKVRHIDLHVNGARRVLEYLATHSEIEQPVKFGKAPVCDTITTLVLRDITQLKEQEQDIAYLSNYDDRTGALRRNAFLSFLGLRLEERYDTIVFALALDRFKTINVTLGRSVGDGILKTVVERLESMPLQLSAATRLGGTSFAFYTEGKADIDAAEHLAHAVLEEIERPYRLEDSNAQVGARIGYTVVPAVINTSAEAALEQAEDAMDASRSTAHKISRYDPADWKRQKRAREIERAMEAALEKGEFQMVYQPQHRVCDGALIGAEALIRWHSPTLGHVFPDEFIGIAESTGFIVELGKWTLEKAAIDIQALPADVSVAVNVSGIQIMRSDLVSDVQSVLDQVGLPAERLCLELTETVLLASTDTIIETMQDLNFLGVTWALDDFGTGFSSMEYLSKMPLSKVKLDKSFTMNLGKDPSARPILHSTSELCRGLGVKLLCEGVETQEQLAALAEEGCEEAQGYFFSKPIPITQLVQAERKALSGR